ncbi:MAG: type II toxin-antitoxin system VapC family toxin [Thermoproteota archaeon]
MLYVADTHAFVWYIIGMLPERINSIFKSAERGESIIYIPTIVLAECLYLVENKKIDVNFRELLSKLEMSANFVPVSLNFQVIKLLPEIKLEELHDRIIVATTKILGAKLITKDEEIRGSKIVETIW